MPLTSRDSSERKQPAPASPGVPHSSHWLIVICSSKTARSWRPTGPRVFFLDRSMPLTPRDSSETKTAGAGLAGRPTLLSLVDRDLFFQDRQVVAADGAKGFFLHRSMPLTPRDSSETKTAGAGLAGRPTRLSLVDRDLFFQDRQVVAADGAKGFFSPPIHAADVTRLFRNENSRRRPRRASHTPLVGGS